MTKSETPDSGTAMDDPAAVSGAMNLNINLPEGLYLTTTPPEMMTPASGIETGTVVTFAGRTAPTGWLLCNGAAVSRATYADLFAVIGTDYGLGNANTTFNLPDLRGRFPLGKDDMGGTAADRVTATEADVLGGSAGAETHTLTVDEMPEHRHGIISNGSSGSSESIATHQDRASRHESNSVIRKNGGNQPHNNMSPYQTLNYIIKT